MSIQVTSGRHRGRAGRSRSRLLRVRRAVRAGLKTAARVLRRAVAPAGTVYSRELLTPRSPGAVRVRHVGGARIGYYTPSYVAAAPKVGDEVRTTYYPIAGWSGLTGTVTEIITDWRPLVVEVPGVGTLTCAPEWLELLDRPAARTLTMAVFSEFAAGGAW